MPGHVFLARWKRDILCRYRAKDWHSRKLSQIPAHYGRRNGFYESADLSANAPRIFPVWFAIVGSLPIFAVILWFLFTSKQAFAAPL